MYITEYKGHGLSGARRMIFLWTKQNQKRIIPSGLGTSSRYIVFVLFLSLSMDLEAVVASDRSDAIDETQSEEHQRRWAFRLNKHRLFLRYWQLDCKKKKKWRKKSRERKIKQHLSKDIYLHGFAVFRFWFTSDIRCVFLNSIHMTFSVFYWLISFRNR